MRRLLLLRHAKAAPAQGRDDYDRPLTEVGRANAGEIAETIAKAGQVPSIVVFSSAIRTRETAEIASSRWASRPGLLANPTLYDATRLTILSVARGLPDDAETAMIVGHNPGIGELANDLAGSGAVDDRRRMAAKYPTSGLAVLSFTVEKWDEIASRGGRLAAFLTLASAAVERD